MSDETVKRDSNTPRDQAVKGHEGKARFDLLPVEALTLASRVMAYGAAKPGRAANDWRKGADWSLYYAAAMRHLLAFWSGEDNDQESGLLHLGHFLCCAFILCVYQLLGLGKDDRPKVADQWFEHPQAPPFEPLKKCKNCGFLVSKRGAEYCSNTCFFAENRQSNCKSCGMKIGAGAILCLACRIAQANR